MMNDIDVIAPNLKRRLSGVTATVVRLVPMQARRIGIVTTGPGLPADMPHVALHRLPFLPRRRRVWHARRNVEMALGLLLKYLFRMDLKLLFTSASQRKHSAYSKWLISKMDRVVATSARTAKYLSVPNQVIHHGIDISGFDASADRTALRARMSLPRGTLIGCYGRVRHQKGTDAFVDAMIKVLPERPNVSALVMGRATEGHADFLSALRRKVGKAGLENRILFLPEVGVDKMPDWYRVLDLYVAPQRWEGFGLTPIEAMACHVPVVATRVGAFEEIVTPQTGTLVKPGDVSGMAVAVAAFLDDREKMQAAGQAARRNVEERFQIEDEARQLIALYQEMLA